MDNFNKQSVKELQAYLKARGVITANYLKAGLVELCTAANDLGICVDPDEWMKNFEFWIKFHWNMFLRV